MVSADTNVIVRLLVGDDKSQSEKAKRLFEEEKIFIATTVVLECEWVLRYAYHFEPIRIADAFQALFGLPNVTLQEQAVVADAIGDWHQQGNGLCETQCIWQRHDIVIPLLLLTGNSSSRQRKSLRLRSRNHEAFFLVVHEYCPPVTHDHPQGDYVRSQVKKTKQ